jgi:hypothetical protein
MWKGQSMNRRYFLIGTAGLACLGRLTMDGLRESCRSGWSGLSSPEAMRLYRRQQYRAPFAVLEKV